MLLKVQSVHSLINCPAVHMNITKRALTACVTRYSESLRGASADTEITPSVKQNKRTPVRATVVYTLEIKFLPLYLIFRPHCPLT